ncbi:MAG: sigma factor-like helix-turn-helix DNA-binding protein [Myxococcota bacterium]
MSGKVRSIDVPQADRLSRVRQVVEAVLGGCSTFDVVGERVGLSFRHAQYYAHAARILGLLGFEKSGLRIDGKGRTLLGTEAGSPNEGEAFREVILDSPFIRRAAGDLFKPELSLVALTGRLIHSTTLSAETARRRARTLMCWRDYVLRLASRAHASHSPQMRLALADRAEHGSIDEELDAGLRVLRARDRAVVLARLSISSTEAPAIAEIGEKFGISRQRAQQIVARSARKLREVRPGSRLLEATLDLLGELAPRAICELDEELQRRAITKGACTRGVIRAAELFGLYVPVEVRTYGAIDFAIPPGAAPQDMIDRARRAVDRWGCSTIEEVLADESLDTAVTGSILQHQPGFEWLDQAAGWFWFTSTKNVLARLIRKILGVARHLHVAQVRAAIRRPSRREGFAPPSGVLLEICRRTEGVRVQQDGLVELVSQDAAENGLSDAEQTLVQILSADGAGVMATRDLEAMCSSRGIARNTLLSCLSGSPVVTRFARGVYGLVGAQPSPGAVTALAEQATRTRRRLVEDWGWNDDGTFRLSYCLSRAAANSGVLSVPAGARRILSGAYSLIDLDTDETAVEIKASTLHGLGRCFRRRGGEEGDRLQLSFNPGNRTVRFELLDNESLLL